MFKHYSNGKLLLTSEYAILDGALALAIPTKFGQFLEVEKNNTNILEWQSYTNNHKIWFSCKFSLPDLKIIYDDKLFNNNDSKIKNLRKILIEIKKLNPHFLSKNVGLNIKTNLTFPLDWGLGSSSTLLNNLSQWARVNPFKLQFNTFGGSAYDIACAQNKNPILYKLVNKEPEIEQVDFTPNFLEQIYFVHLNKKQNTREGIAKYKESKNDKCINELTQLTKEVVKLNDLKDFEKIIIEHEKIIASIIKEKPVKKILFKDYFGEIKSLGAWGGDFVLATGNNDSIDYFKNKGYSTVIKYKDMIL